MKHYLLFLFSLITYTSFAQAQKDTPANDSLENAFRRFEATLEAIEAKPDTVLSVTTPPCDEYTLQWVVSITYNVRTLRAGSGETYCKGMKEYEPAENDMENKPYMMYYRKHYIAGRYLVVSGDLPTNSINMVTYYYVRKGEKSE